MEYFQEIFDVDNTTASYQLANCLLYYCYLPVVLGSLVCLKQKPSIALNTA